jgi:hypothetical protein
MLGAVAEAVGLTLDELLAAAARRLGDRSAPAELPPAIGHVLVGVPAASPVRPTTIDPICRAA